MLLTEQGQYDSILQSFLQSFSSAETIAETESQDLPANAIPTQTLQSLTENNLD